MYNVELRELPPDFAELLDRVLSGEEVIISQAGTPIAPIVPISAYSFHMPHKFCQSRFYHSADALPDSGFPGVGANRNFDRSGCWHSPSGLV